MGSGDGEGDKTWCGECGHKMCDADAKAAKNICIYVYIYFQVYTYSKQIVTKDPERKRERRGEIDEHGAPRASSATFNFGGPKVVA